MICEICGKEIDLSKETKVITIQMDYLNLIPTEELDDEGNKVIKGEGTRVINGFICGKECFNKFAKERAYK